MNNLLVLQALVTMISLHLKIRPREERLLRNELLTLKFIAQMFQAGAVTECAATLVSFRHPSPTGKKRAKHHH